MRNATGGLIAGVRGGIVVRGWLGTTTLWILLGLLGCGKVGDPLPPAPRLPLRARDLSVRQQGPFIILRWPNPNVKTLESLGFPLQRIDVYRLLTTAQASATLQEGEFAERATIIGSITQDHIEATAVGEEVVFRDGPITQFNRTYAYAVRLVSARGESTVLSNIIRLDPSPRVAMAPRNLRAHDATQDVVGLMWEAPPANIDDSSPPLVLGYNLYRRSADQPHFGLPLNGTMPISTVRYTDRQFMYETEYVYTVRAISRNAQGDSIESADAEVATHTPRDTFPPAAPENLAAGSANDVISIFWSTNTEADLAGYNVYRAERRDAPDPEWSRLNPELLTSNIFRDENAVHGKTYYYQVTAIDRAGNVSPPSTIIAQEAQ